MSPNPKPNLSPSDTSVTQTDTFNLTQKQIQMARTTKKTATNNSTEIETVTGPLTADTVNRIVWRACDTFRGVVEPSSYKDYILTMLFVKYLTDMRDEAQEKFREQYKGDEERVERAMSKQRFILPPKSDFHFLKENSKSAQLGDLINKLLARISDANRGKLEDVFRDIDFNSNILGETKDRNTRLQHLVDDFSNKALDLRSTSVQGNDVIGNAYEFLIGHFAAESGKSGGEFYTPKEVAQILASILAPKEGETICDPCCGSGSLLLRVGNKVGSNNYALFGQELNSHTWALCRMNMFLHDVDSARIERGDTIRSPKLVDNKGLMKFDVVIANPPFGVDKWGDEMARTDPYGRFNDGVAPKSRGEFAFIQHMVATLKETNGRAGIVVPLGVLFRGASEGVIRRAFIEKNLVDAVIGLPANLFFGVGIPTALFILRKDKKDDKILFIDASRDFEEGKAQNFLSDVHMTKILDAYKARKIMPKYSHLATREEVAGNDFNLNIPLYVDTFEEEAPVDLVAVKSEIERIDRELVTTRAELGAALKELGL